jgi:hypothetical protein
MTGTVSLDDRTNQVRAAARDHTSTSPRRASVLDVLVVGCNSRTASAGSRARRSRRAGPDERGVECRADDEPRSSTALPDLR